MATAATRAEAQIKQLCCLGLPSEAVVPALIRELRGVIPFFGATFFWATDGGDFANVYDEHPESPHVMQLYLEEFYGRRERELGIDFHQAMRSERGPHVTEDVIKMDLKSYYATDSYNLLLRPLGYQDFLRIVVRDPARPGGLGGPMLFRSPRERPFTSADKKRLAGLESFMAHLLVAPARRDFALAEGDNTGLIIADAAGKPLFSSPEGRRLLFLATHPQVAPGAAISRLLVLPRVLVQMCRNLAGIFASDLTAGAPVHHHRNVWGGFDFRAHWLEGSDRDGGLIGITVSHIEPLLVKVLRGLERLPLSRRQAQVCLLLAGGSRYGEIASRLGISKHTAIAHGRWVYDKLDVHSRAELVNRLVDVSREVH